MAILRTPMPRLIDISIPPTRGLPTWPGSTGFRVERARGFELGDELTVSRLDLDLHTGTHVESALHYIEGGEPIETMPLDTLVGPATVVDLRVGGCHWAGRARCCKHPRWHRAAAAANAELGPPAAWRGVSPELRGAHRGWRLQGTEAAPARAILEPLP